MKAAFDLGLEPARSPSPGAAAGPPVLKPAPPPAAPSAPPSVPAVRPPAPGSGLRAPRAVLLAGLTLGVCVDAFFFNKPLGVSALLFVLLALGALRALDAGENVRPSRASLWLHIPLLFFAAMIGVRANETLTFLNVLTCLVLLCLVADFHGKENLFAQGLGGYFAAVARVAVNGLWRAAPVTRDAWNQRKRRENSSGAARNLLPVVRGLLLAFPILLVFGALLASADLVFSHYLERLERFELPADVDVYVQRAATVVVAAWILAGALAYALARGKETDTPTNTAAAARPLPPLGFTEAMIVLGSVVLLFGAFVAIQFAYLFGGSANVVTREGFTWAEYVHRGFGELVTVAALTLALILGLHRLTRREGVIAMRAFNALATLLVGLMLVLLASALQRLLLYEAAYGFTGARLQVHVFLIWLGVCLFALAVSLWLGVQRGWAFGGVVAALGMLATLNLLNPDATVARQNIARFQATGKIDVAYLANLSDDAVPLLARATPTIRVVVPAGYNEWSREPGPAYTLGDRLRERKRAMDADRRWRAWPAFHLARSAAYRALGAVR